MYLNKCSNKQRILHKDKLNEVKLDKINKVYFFIILKTSIYLKFNTKRVAHLLSYWEIHIILIIDVSYNFK